MRHLVWTLLALLLLAGPARAELVVGIEAQGYGHPGEQNALTATLTAMGHTVVVKGPGDIAGVDVFVSYPSSGGAGSGPTTAQIAAGARFVQIGDWGTDWTPNTWMSLGEDVGITLQIEAAHPLTAGLSPAWKSRGFWRYGYDSGDFIGWSEDASLTSLVSETMLTGGRSHLLAADEIGAGRAVYIGWNVYGPDATADDLKVLSNALLWAQEGGPILPAPEPSGLLLVCVGALGASLTCRPNRRSPATKAE